MEKQERENKESMVSSSIDPSVVDAVKQHIAEIGYALERLQSALRIPHIYEMMGDPIVDIDNLELEPLFECLKEHLPSDDFWGKVSEWRRLFEQYQTYCNSIVFDFTDEEKIWQGKIQKLEDFTNPILHRIERSSLLSSGKVFAVDHRFAIQPKRLKQEDDQFPSTEILIVDDHEVLEANDASAYISFYKSMSNRFLNNEATMNIIRIHNQLRSISYGIEKHLGKFLLTRKYGKYKCNMCRELISK